MINAEPAEFWWPRGESLKDVLAPIPPRYTIVQACDASSSPGRGRTALRRADTPRRAVEGGRQDRRRRAAAHPSRRSDVVVGADGTVRWRGRCRCAPGIRRGLRDRGRNAHDEARSSRTPPARRAAGSARAGDRGQLRAPDRATRALTFGHPMSSTTPPTPSNVPQWARSTSRGSRSTSPSWSSGSAGSNSGSGRAFSARPPGASSAELASAGWSRPKSAKRPAPRPSPRRSRRRVTVIKPGPRWPHLDLAELWHYRELLGAARVA